MKFERTCLVCKEKKPRQQMHRIVKMNGKLVLDTNQDIQARGTYICKNITCHDKIKKQRVFHRAFKQNIPDVEYDNILNEIGSAK